MIWVGGRIVHDDALTISVLDRTFEHGLGLFETLRTWNGHPTLLARHLDRLTRSALELRIPLDPAALPDPAAVAALARSDRRETDAALRITLSGGLSESHGSTLWMRSFPLPPPVAETGFVLGPAHPARVDRLAGHKTLNYWSNRLMYQTAQEGGCDECVMVSPDGTIWEGSRSNLFVVVDGQLLTPPCTGTVLPGIMRGVILEQAARMGLDIREAILGLFDRQFLPEEVFLSNSVRGIMPVGSWGEARFPAPGPIARRLWNAILPWLESGGAT
jgi:branched-subunit amino acid aminotransferase/4-amino-4-deoxychorismate lyase